MGDEKHNPLGDLLRTLTPEQAAAAFMGTMAALEKQKPKVIDVPSCYECPFDGPELSCGLDDDGHVNEERFNSTDPHRRLPDSCPLRRMNSGVLVRAKT